MRADHDHTLEAEIARLDDLGLDDLRKLWGRLVGEVPAHHGASLLRRDWDELQRAPWQPAEARRRLKHQHHAFGRSGIYTVTRPWTETGTVLTRPGAVNTSMSWTTALGTGANALAPCRRSPVGSQTLAGQAPRSSA